MITKAEISFVKSLSDKKARTESGLFAVEGRKMVEEALVSGIGIRRIFGTGEFAGIAGVETVSAKDMERISSLKTPQGIIALLEIPVHTLPADLGRSLTLALDGIQDPGNLGTIIRLADWFGITDIVCSSDTADCFGPKAAQATMGAIFRVRVHYGPLPGILKNNSTPGTSVYGAFLDGENIYTADLGKHPSGIIVLGNEGNGIGEQTALLVTRRLYIPPFPAGRHSSESLNVAVAAGVLCSEFRRR